MTDGILIHSKLLDCKCDPHLLVDSHAGEAQVMAAVLESRLTPVSSDFISFSKEKDDQYGYSGTITFAESHCSIHTWPELNNRINLQIYVCNVTSDNTDKARHLFQLCQNIFKPESVKSVEFSEF